jgi:hypothetical protein
MNTNIANALDMVLHILRNVADGLQPHPADVAELKGAIERIKYAPLNLSK